MSDDESDEEVREKNYKGDDVFSEMEEKGVKVGVEEESKGNNSIEIVGFYEDEFGLKIE